MPLFSPDLFKLHGKDAICTAGEVRVVAKIGAKVCVPLFLKKNIESITCTLQAKLAILVSFGCFAKLFRFYSKNLIERCNSYATGGCYNYIWNYVRPKINHSATELPLSTRQHRISNQSQPRHDT